MSLATERYLRSKGMLEPGYNTMVIKGKFGEVDLADLLDGFLKQEVDRVNATLSIPNIVAKLPEGTTEADVAKFKKDWNNIMKDNKGQIIFNSQEPEKEVKDLLICITESASDNPEIMRSLLGKVIVNQSRKLYNKYGLGKPRQFNEEGA